MTDQMLKDALEGIADRAEPVDGMAERALKGARRRRTVRLSGVASAVAVATAAAIAVPIAGQPDGGRTLAGPRDGTTANTAAERALARACLRNGPPAGHMGQDRPDIGKARDFWLLVAVKENRRHLALVGGTSGFVLCSGSDATGNADLPTFHRWTKAFEGALSVDAIGHLQAASPKGVRDDGHGIVFAVAGRVKPQVSRVQVTWTGGRTVWATVDNGYYIAGTPGRRIPDKGATGPMSDGAMKDEDRKVTSVTAYTAGGGVVDRWRAGPGEGGMFFHEDCPRTTSTSLC
ncbi:hypothetical protein [Spirillospora albida]|uniref:hypothetical protein n=1 Tax=Spirillospora albida TaxID=58123 RepID=UPI0004BE820B|nr:hypothetical protein [Spirillospora albida]